MLASSRLVASGALDEHRAAQAPADANGRNPALAPRALEYVEQMQDDARARRADGMPQRDRAAVDIELCRVEHTHGSIEPELAAAIRLACPCAQAPEHLRRERLVDFPCVEIVQSQSMTLQDR